MSLLSVYVEGSKDASAQGVRRLAAAIASRYGLSAPDLEKRLVAGRFRVKANVDEETAQAFARDLEALGARCSIVAAEAKAVRGLRGMPAIEEPVMLAPDRVPGSSRPVSAGEGGRSEWARPRTATPGIADGGAAEPAIPRSATPGAPVVSRSATPIARTVVSPVVPPPGGSMERLVPRPVELPARAAASATAPPTGLASALADATYKPGGLGALDGATFSLSTLDGQDDPDESPIPPPASFAPISPAVASSSASVPPFSSLTPSFAPSSAPVAHDDDRTSPSLPPAMDQLGDPIESPPPYETSSPYQARRAATASRPTIWPVSPSRPIEPITTFTADSRPPRAGHAAIDLFAPPPEDGAPPAAELLEELRPRRGSLAPEGAPMRAPAIAPAPAAPRAHTSVSTLVRRQLGLRVAFAAGVLAAVLIAFVPAHLVAQARERAAYEKIDNRVRIAQSEITTLDEWKALDDVRTALLRRKRAAHQEIVLLSLLLWIGLAGGLSFAWVRLGLPRWGGAGEL